MPRRLALSTLVIAAAQLHPHFGLCWSALPGQRHRLAALLPLRGGRIRAHETSDHEEREQVVSASIRKHLGLGAKESKHEKRGATTLRPTKTPRSGSGAGAVGADDADVIVRQGLQFRRSKDDAAHLWHQMRSGKLDDDLLERAPEFMDSDEVDDWDALYEGSGEGPPVDSVVKSSTKLVGGKEQHPRQGTRERAPSHGADADVSTSMGRQRERQQPSDQKKHERIKKKRRRKKQERAHTDAPAETSPRRRDFLYESEEAEEWRQTGGEQLPVGSRVWSGVPAERPLEERLECPTFPHPSPSLASRLKTPVKRGRGKDAEMSTPTRVGTSSIVQDMESGRLHDIDLVSPPRKSALRRSAKAAPTPSSEARKYPKGKQRWCTPEEVENSMHESMMEEEQNWSGADWSRIGVESSLDSSSGSSGAKASLQFPFSRKQWKQEKTEGGPAVPKAGAGSSVFDDSSHTSSSINDKKREATVADEDDLLQNETSGKKRHKSRDKSKVRRPAITSESAKSTPKMRKVGPADR